MNKKGTVLISLGIAVIIAGISLLGYNIYDAKRAEDTADEAYLQMSSHLADVESEIDSYTKHEDVEFVPDYVLWPDMEMPVAEIDGRDYVGVLQIPALSLELPILSECTSRLLRIAPCRYEGSAYKDGFIIAAHNYRSHFSKLKNLYPGDEIIFRDNAGNVFNYKVVLQETLEPTDVEEMQSGGWALTLFTCTPGGQYRVTVRCESAD